MANLDLQNRAPKVERLPDYRERVTRVYDVLNNIPKDPAKILEIAWLPWGTQDEKYPNCRLIKQDVAGQDGAFRKPVEEPPILIRIFEQILEFGETQVGNPGVSFDQAGNKTIVIDWLQFSAGTSTYQIVGTTPAQAPFSDCILKLEERTNDGTLQRIRRTYIDNGILSDVETLKFGGKLLLRELTYLNEIPPTPAGWTLVTQSVEFPAGLPVYKYGFANANGGASSGDGAEISREVEYEISPDQGTTGMTIYTIQWISPVTVDENPIEAPASTELIDEKYQDEDGYRLWTAKYATGQGTILSTVDTKEDGKLKIYRKIAIHTAPTAPAATIGGTVVLISAETRNGTNFENGEIVFEYVWAEGNGQVDLDVSGREDGSLVYNIAMLGAAAATPEYPGSGTAYLVGLKTEARDGYVLNRATYIKPPATKTFNKTMQWEKPGVASFGGEALDQLILQPPCTMTILAEVEVSYDVTELDDVPWTVSSYATFYFSYTPSTNPPGGDPGNPTVSGQQGLGGYLAQASGVHVTDDFYNGVLCDQADAVLISSVPDVLPSGDTVLHTDNDPYLVALDGTVVYRRKKTSYTFS